MQRLTPTTSTPTTARRPVTVAALWLAMLVIVSLGSGATHHAHALLNHNHTAPDSTQEHPHTCHHHADPHLPDPAPQDEQQTDCATCDLLTATRAATLDLLPDAAIADLPLLLTFHLTAPRLAAAAHAAPSPPRGPPTVAP